MSAGSAIVTLKESKRCISFGIFPVFSATASRTLNGYFILLPLLMPKFFWQYPPAMRAVDYFWAHVFFVSCQTNLGEEKKGRKAAEKLLRGNIASLTGVRIQSPLQKHRGFGWRPLAAHR
jgi:hypothetical protein